MGTQENYFRSVSWKNNNNNPQFKGLEIKKQKY